MGAIRGRLVAWWTLRLLPSRASSAWGGYPTPTLAAPPPPVAVAPITGELSPPPLAAPARSGIGPAASLSSMPTRSPTTRARPRRLHQPRQYRLLAAQRPCPRQRQPRLDDQCRRGHLHPDAWRRELARERADRERGDDDRGGGGMEHIHRGERGAEHGDIPGAAHHRGERDGAGRDDPQRRRQCPSAGVDGGAGVRVDAAGARSGQYDQRQHRERHGREGLRRRVVGVLRGGRDAAARHGERQHREWLPR